MGLLVCLEMLVRNYRYLLCNNHEQHNSQALATVQNKEPICFSNNSFILILKSTHRLLNKNTNITVAARDSKTWLENMQHPAHNKLQTMKTNPLPNSFNF
jgi:hypothetical protein